MKQLAEQDASFLYLETPETPMHVGGLSLIELPRGYSGNFYEDYKNHIARRLHLVPQLSQKLLSLPFDIDHPIWIEADVDIDYHIRHVSLPKPGNRRQLEELVARLHSNFLDRSRPLWEFYVIEGLDSGHIGVYTKVHHAAMDGAASMLLVSAMHDTTPLPKDPPPAPAKPACVDKLSPSNVIGAVVRHLLQQEIRTIHFVPELLKAWTHLALPDIDTLKFTDALKPPPRAPKTMLNVDITSQRAYAARTLPLADVKWIAQQANVKINDVALALCGSVLRRYLGEKGELPPPPLTAMVPVSLRDPKDKELNNQNSMMICSLATDLASATDRLDAVAESANQQKKLFKNVRNIMMPELSFIGSGIVMRGLVNLSRSTKLAGRLPPLANLPVSNVQGPTVPLYLAGGKVLTFYPVSIPAHNAALNITVESYCSSLDIGLTACRRTVPDIAELADMFAPALEELKAGIAVRAAKASEAPVAAKKTRETAGAPASRATAKAVPRAMAKPRVAAVSARLGPAAKAARPAKSSKTPKAPRARGKSKTERPGRAGVASAATAG